MTQSGHVHLIHEKLKSYVEELCRTMKSYDSLCYKR